MYLCVYVLVRVRCSTPLLFLSFLDLFCSLFAEFSSPLPFFWLLLLGCLSLAQDAAAGAATRSMASKGSTLAGLLAALKNMESASGQLPSGPEYFYYRSFHNFRENASQAVAKITSTLRDDLCRATGGNKKLKLSSSASASPLSSADGSGEVDADECVEWLEEAQDGEFSRVDRALQKMQAALERKVAADDRSGNAAVAGGSSESHAVGDGRYFGRKSRVPFHVSLSG